MKFICKFAIRNIQLMGLKDIHLLKMWYSENNDANNNSKEIYNAIFQSYKYMILTITSKYPRQCFITIFFNKKLSICFLLDIYISIFWTLLFIAKIIHLEKSNNQMIYHVTHETLQVILITIYDIYKEILCTRNSKDVSKSPAQSKKVRIQENNPESKLGRSRYVKMRGRKFICRSTQAKNEQGVLLSHLYLYLSSHMKSYALQVCV